MVVRIASGTLSAVLLASCAAPVPSAAVGSGLASPVVTAAAAPAARAATGTTGAGAPDAATRGAVLVGAGDVGWCGASGDEATAKLVAGIAGTVFVAGDIAYPNGTAADFARCYDPTWGQFKSRTRPTPGNHEYNTEGAAPYFTYFSSRAGTPGRGWYSYDLGTWHVVVLNSECDAVGGCSAGSPQERWLRKDLAAHPALCTLAYWHRPRFSSGPHGNDPRTAALWQALADAGAEIVINGHDHDYERFAPQTPAGKADPAHGIREFVVGTGGAPLYWFIRQAPNSERRALAHGVLKLTLLDGSYRWKFIPVAGLSFDDSGTGLCH